MIHWPTSGTTRVFRNLKANQGIEIVEFENEYAQSKWKPKAMAGADAK
jgi:hypothetical protein